MSSKLYSYAVIGLDAELVTVEADTGGGELGSFSLVGLPDLAISEARERVRAAIRNSAVDFPKLKVTVNLAPASLKKQGSGFDLPIALSVLMAAGKIREQARLEKSIFVGELALDGLVRGVNGILPVAIKAKADGFVDFYCSESNAAEASLVEGLNVFAVKNLKELILTFQGLGQLEKIEFNPSILENKKIDLDLAFVCGQEQAKRALEIAAAGGHNILMSGPPGSGKTMLSQALASILPDLNFTEALEITKIYSVAGLINSKQSLIKARPFRSPHHSASAVALIGGGSWPRPGEISLAHRGVLFLDEFPEFPRAVLEMLRQPLENGEVTVSRAAGNLIFPAKFILVAAMNPCPCGFKDDKDKECLCTAGAILKYQRKISGPILDRIDLHIEVPRLSFDKLTAKGTGASSAEIKKRVEEARAFQTNRFKKDNIFINAEMSSQQVKKYCLTDAVASAMLKTAVERLNLSPRGYFRLLKTARTIADLAKKDIIEKEHIAEALQLRSLV